MFSSELLDAGTLPATGRSMGRPEPHQDGPVRRCKRRDQDVLAGGDVGDGDVGEVVAAGRRGRGRWRRRWRRLGGRWWRFGGRWRRFGGRWWRFVGCRGRWGRLGAAVRRRVRTGLRCRCGGRGGRRRCVLRRCGSLRRRRRCVLRRWRFVGCRGRWGRLGAAVRGRLGIRLRRRCGGGSGGGGLCVSALGAPAGGRDQHGDAQHGDAQQTAGTARRRSLRWCCGSRMVTTRRRHRGAGPAGA